MASVGLGQRPPARFFAAFYRWSRSTQRSTPCDHLIRLRQGNSQPLKNPGSSRSFVTSRARLHQAQTLADGQPGQAIATEEGESREEAPQKERTQQFDSVANEAPGLDVPDETEQLRNSVRLLMRRVPSSVAVITTSDAALRSASHNSTLVQPVGIAVSSFNTVTLDPPTVSFNIRQPSRALDAIRSANGRFRAHFVDSGRRAASIVDLFSQGNSEDALTRRRNALGFHVPRNRAHPTHIQDTSVLGALECQVLQEVKVADHVVVIARVDSIETNDSKSSVRSLLYVDGKYLRDDGVVLRRSGVASSEKKEINLIRDSFYTMPLFMEKNHRLQIRDQIVSYLKNDKRLAALPTDGARKELLSLLQLPVIAFSGISLRRLIEHCKTEGEKSTSSEADQDFFYEYFGRLSSSDISKIVERAKVFVQEDRRYLDLHFKHLFELMDVDWASTGMLASDILEPLQVEGIVKPLESRTTSEFKPGQADNPGDLQYLEQLESNLRQYLRTKHYDYGSRMRSQEMADAIGEKNPVMRQYITHIRARILTQAHPGLFTEDKFDFSGHLSRGEALAVVNRIIRSLIIKGPRAFKHFFLTPWFEHLRRSRIDPMISGLDPEYLFDRLEHIQRTASNAREVYSSMEVLTAPYLTKHLSLVELDKRARNFVVELPPRFTAWNKGDTCAAMGIDVKAAVTDPSFPEPMSIRQGALLGEVLKRAFEAHRTTRSAEQNQQIATWLKSIFAVESEGSEPVITYHSYGWADEAGVLSQRTHSGSGGVQDKGARAPVSHRPLKVVPSWRVEEAIRATEMANERAWRTYKVDEMAEKSKEPQNVRPKFL